MTTEQEKYFTKINNSYATSFFSTNLIGLYRLYNDDSEALLEGFEDIAKAIHDGAEIAVQTEDLNVLLNDFSNLFSKISNIEKEAAKDFDEEARNYYETYKLEEDESESELDTKDLIRKLGNWSFDDPSEVVVEKLAYLQGVRKISGLIRE